MPNNNKPVDSSTPLSRRTLLRNSSFLVLAALTPSCATLDMIQKNISVQRGSNNPYGDRRTSNSSKNSAYTRIAMDRITKAGKLSEPYAGMPMSNWHKAMQLYAANSDQNILNAQPDLWALSKLYWAELMLEENRSIKMSNLQNIRKALRDAEANLSADARNKLGTLLPNSALTASLLANDLREAGRWLKAGQKYRNRGLTDTKSQKALYREDLIEFYSLAAHTAALKSDSSNMWSWIESGQAYSRNSAFYTNTKSKVNPYYVEQDLKKSLNIVDAVLGITISSAGSSIVATTKIRGKLVSRVMQLVTPNNEPFDRHAMERILYGSTFNQAFSRAALGGWMGAYAATDQAGSLSTSNAFLNTIQKLSVDHWQAFGRPIKEILEKLSITPESKIALIIPDQMAFLPLRAAKNPINGKSLLDYYSIAQVPSLKVLNNSLFQKHTLDRNILGLYNPTGDIKNSLLEKHFVSNSLKLLRVKELAAGMSAGTFMRTLQRNNPQYIYLSTHGSALSSTHHGIFLGGNNLLTANDVRNLKGSLNTELVVISACEVAAGSFGLEHQASNLASAFLGKGVKGVISALWRVEVNATALLMSKFMERYINDGIAPAQALTEAQQWLRDSSIDQLSRYLTELLIEYPSSDTDAIKSILLALGDNQKEGSSKPYENPSYWGGFIYLGA